jgi:CTP:molybdopterin cytidylyltransferase MocA
VEVCAIVAAAGAGTRLGMGSKALLSLNGKTLVARAVELFDALE